MRHGKGVAKYKNGAHEWRVYDGGETCELRVEEGSQETLTRTLPLPAQSGSARCVMEAELKRGLTVMCTLANGSPISMTVKVL
jgi:hypothetical protein